MPYDSSGPDAVARVALAFEGGGGSGFVIHCLMDLSPFSNICFEWPQTWKSQKQIGSVRGMSDGLELWQSAAHGQKKKTKL